MKIHVNFLGNTEIFINEKPIYITQQKIKGILFYILYNEVVSRDEIVSVFWPEYQNSIGKNNLRNILYKIRKNLDYNLILTKGNDLVYINDNYELTKDVDIFNNESNSDELKKINEFTFMKDLLMKDNIEYEDWVNSIRFAYERMLLNRFSSELEKSILNNNSEDILIFAKKITDIDPYYERAYQALMINFYNQGRFNMAIKVYDEIKKILSDELGIEVEPRTQKLYEEILEAKNLKNIIEDKGFINNSEVIRSLEEEYSRFINNEEYNNCFVIGEFGVGKGEAIKIFLRNINTEILGMNLDLEESSIKYSFIMNLIQTISCNKDIDYNFFTAENFQKEYFWIQEIKKYLNNIKDKKIIYIRNIQYIDTNSLYILEKSIMDENKIFLILECTESFSSNLKSKLEDESLLNFRRVYLGLLNFKQTKEYIKFLHSNNYIKIDKMVNVEEVYKNSHGNLMFIEDEINKKYHNLLHIDNKIMLVKVRELYKSLNLKELIVIKILSTSLNGVEFEILKIISKIDYYELINILNSLIDRRILVEKREGQYIIVDIKYMTLKSHINSLMPKYEMLEFHKKSVEIIEKFYIDYLDNYYILNELYYHYRSTYEKHKRIYYEIYIIKYRLDYLDQFFPKTNKLEATPKEAFMSKGEIYNYLDNLNNELYSQEDYFPKEIYNELILNMKFLRGRTLIRGGKKEDGIEYIYDLTEMSKKIGNNYFLQKSYLESILYNLRKNNFGLMMDFINEGFKLNQMDPKDTVAGELYRLSGLQKLLIGEYDLAIKSLNKSVEIFSKYKLKEKYAVQRAAAYSYLGEVYRRQGRYIKGKEYHLKCIGICQKYNIDKPLDGFYQFYGQMLFDMGEYVESKEILLKSLEIYDSYGTHWNRSIVESCLGLIAFFNNKKEDALIYYRKAEIFSRIYGTNEEIRLLNSLKNKLNI